MNEQLTKAITDVLVVVKDGATFAAAAAQRELPVLVEEYLRLAIWQGVVAGLVWCGVAMALVRTGRYAFNKATQYDEARYVIGSIICIALGIAHFVTLVTRVLPAVEGAFQAAVAPRVYLLERLSELVK